MYIDQEKFKSFCFAMVMFVLGFVMCYCMFCRGNIQNNGERADNIGEQISSSQSQQHIVTEQVRETQQQVSDIRSIVSNSGNAITDIEQILQGIRKRGKN